jgi:hypothetical protein
MAWPKIIDIGGIKVPIDSWAELKEARQEFGDELTVNSDDQNQTPRPTNQSASTLNHGDRTLLVQFIEAADRGLLTGQLSQAVGKKGKGVLPALGRWSRRIGLVTEESASAFERVKRFDGRGFFMVEHYRRIAAAMVGRSIS